MEIIYIIVAVYLIQNADKDHPVSRQIIIEYIETNYRIRIERRRFYKVRYGMNDLGMEITYDHSKNGYYFSNPFFTDGEILHIFHAIHSCHFIPHNESQNLIEKIRKMCSSYTYKYFNNHVFLPNRRKCISADTLNNLELIAHAITDRKKISFNYTHYNLCIQKEIVNKYPIIVEPQFIVYDDSRPYLISTGGKISGFMHYRVDKIRDIKILDASCSNSPDENEAYNYASNKLFMFKGKQTAVTFRCKIRILDAMVDIFGTNIHLHNCSEETFEFTESLTDTGAVFLAQQYLDAVEIVQPAWLRDIMIKRLRQTIDSYMQ